MRKLLPFAAKHCKVGGFRLRHTIDGSAKKELCSKCCWQFLPALCSNPRKVLCIMEHLQLKHKSWNRCSERALHSNMKQGSCCTLPSVISSFCKWFRWACNVACIYPNVCRKASFEVWLRIRLYGLRSQKGDLLGDAVMTMLFSQVPHPHLHWTDSIISQWAPSVTLSPLVLHLLSHQNLPPVLFISTPLTPVNMWESLL